MLAVKISERRTKVMVALLLVVCTVGARAPGLLGDALWQDEVGTERVLVMPTPRGAVSQILRRESTPPVFYLAEWAPNRVLSGRTSDLTRIRILRSLPLAFSAATTVLTFLLAAELLSLWGAAVVGLIVSLASQLLIHGAELRSYSLLALCCVALATALSRARDPTSAPRLAAVTVAVVIGSLTHYFFLLTVAGSLLWLLIERRIWGRICFALVVGLIPIAAWSPLWLRQYRNGTCGTSPRFTLGRVDEVVSSLFVPQSLTGAFGGVASVALLGVVIVTAGRLLLRRGEQRLIGLLVLVPLFTSAVVSALGPRIFNARNLIGVAPFAAIAVVAGLESVPSVRLRRMLISAVAMVVVLVSSVGQASLGRTPYDSIASEMVAQGTFRGEPVVWFGRFGGFVVVGRYLAHQGPSSPCDCDAGKHDLPRRFSGRVGAGGACRARSKPLRDP